MKLMIAAIIVTSIFSSAHAFADASNANLDPELLISADCTVAKPARTYHVQIYADPRANTGRQSILVFEEIAYIGSIDVDNNHFTSAEGVEAFVNRDKNKLVTSVTLGGRFHSLELNTCKSIAISD